MIAPLFRNASRVDIGDKSLAQESAWLGNHAAVHKVGNAAPVGAFLG